MTTATRDLAGPRADELEVSVFGRGVGESLAVHLGLGEWAIVDSHRTEDGTPVAMAYLRSIDVDPISSVKLVVATHWHDDHIKGLAETYETCANAMFVCPIALKVDELLALIDLAGERGSIAGVPSGVRELEQILARVEDRRADDADRDHLIWAKRDGLIYRQDVQGVALRVTALAPSDYDFETAARLFASLIDDFDRAATVPVRGRNNLSLVLWVDAGAQRILLGGDLENGDNNATGWPGVLRSLTPDGTRASLFKIPHHGSKNGDHPPVWASLLEDQPHAPLTPYSALQDPLPTDGDIDRIRSRTRNAWVSGRPGRRKRQADPLVRRFVSAQTVSGTRVLSGSAGQSRFRAPLSSTGVGAWEADFSGAAGLL